MPKCFHQALNRKPPARGADLSQIALFSRCATNENDWKCSESWTFGLNSKFKLVFLQKINFDFFKKIKAKNLRLQKKIRLKNHQFWSSHQKLYFQKIPSSAFNKDNVSTLKMILLQIYAVSFCSIRVSIKSYTLQQKDWIAPPYTAIFELDFWFPDSSKACSW